MAFTGKSEQIRQARDFTEQMQKEYGLNSENTQSGTQKAGQRQLL